MSLKPGETLDDLTRDGMKVIQSKDGYRFSMDSVLLAHFAEVNPGDEVLDLGCGSGVISFLLAGRQPSCRITGLEIQPELADRARRGAEHNGVAHRMGVINGDLRQAELFLGNRRFNLIVANPPFWRQGEGRPNPDRERLIARHEVESTLEDYVEAARRILVRGGRLAMVHRADRILEIENTCAQKGLALRRIRFIHPYLDRDANLLLVEAVKGTKARVRILPPLVVYNSDGSYTEEMLSIYFEE
ncbi:MAG: tRNA1(Val) (adenine(37)-N6)-methyltransferase [Syntrophomonadales bacterium]